MTRPWLTLAPLLADYARHVGLLRLSAAELRGLHAPLPPELRCWRTTPEGRQWQAQVQAAVNEVDARLNQHATRERRP